MLSRLTVSLCAQRQSSSESVLDACDRVCCALGRPELANAVLDLQVEQTFGLKEPSVTDAQLGLAPEPIEHAQARAELAIGTGRQVRLSIPAQAEVGDQALRDSHAILDVGTVAVAARRNSQCAYWRRRPSERCEQSAAIREARVGVTRLALLQLHAEAPELSKRRLELPGLLEAGGVELAAIVDATDDLVDVVHDLVPRRLELRRVKPRRARPRVAPIALELEPRLPAVRIARRSLLIGGLVLDREHDIVAKAQFAASESMLRSEVRTDTKE